MKLQQVAKICKTAKCVRLFGFEDETQWISDGTASYPVEHLFELNQEAIYTIFDIPENQRDKYSYSHEHFPAGLNFSDSDAAERALDPPGMDIHMDGRRLRPLTTSLGLIFIDTAYLKPLADEAQSLELYERIDTSAKPYVAAKIGMYIAGIILPYDDIINREFVTGINNIAALSKVALDNKQAQAK